MGESIPVQALPGRIIVQFAKPKEQTTSGLLFIPKISQRITRNVARVVDVGPAVTDADRIFIHEVKRGDFVVAKPSYGTEFAVGEGDDAIVYHIYRMFEIIGKLPPETEH